MVGCGVVVAVVIDHAGESSSSRVPRTGDLRTECLGDAPTDVNGFKRLR